MRLAPMLPLAWLPAAFFSVLACVEGEAPSHSTDGAGAADAAAPGSGGELAGGNGVAAAGGSGTGGSGTGGGSVAGAAAALTGGSGAGATGAAAGLSSGGTAATGGVVVVATGGNAGGGPACSDPDAPPVDPSPGSIVVEYLVGDTSASVSTIQARFNVTKTEVGYVPLHLLKFRYWYTPDGITDQKFECYHAEIGSGKITHTFGTDYIEIGFDPSAGDLNLGQDTGEIQMAIHPTDYQGTYDQTNDHSFDASATSFSSNEHVTLYYCGQLLSGIEPG
jgi:hypothetical protein